jgi:hypothetical protein
MSIIWRLVALKRKVAEGYLTIRDLIINLFPCFSGLKYFGALLNFFSLIKKKIGPY